MGWRAQVAAAVLGAGSVTAVPVLGAGDVCSSPAGRMASAAVAAGLPAEHVTTAVAVGLAESGGRPEAVNAANHDGSVDRGAWQVNSIHRQYDPDLLFDLSYNAEAMVEISGNGENWRPWVAFTTGAFESRMVEARTVEHCAVNPSPGAVDGGARLSAFELVDKAATDLVYGAAARVCAAGVDCNRWQAYTGSSSPAAPQARTGARRGDGFDPTFGAALDRMIADAPGPITVTSGVRTPAEQKILYDRYLSGAGNLAAWSDGVSCSSDHCAGTAADLGFASAAVEGWAHRNAGRYGLETGVSFGEPWHFSLAVG